MESYYRIMLGRKSSFAEECIRDKWFGGGWGIDQDLTNELPDNWRDFNAKFIPVYREANSGKSKIAAGLGCGMLHTICKGIERSNILLCPDGTGDYHVGTVVSDYFYAASEPLPHRRRLE
jgi:restriction system protein